MKTGSIDRTQELHVRCADCAHTWKLADLPLSISELARVTEEGACPACGSKDMRITFPDRCDSATTEEGAA